MKNNLDLIESKLNSLSRFASDLSQRTQETDLLEQLQTLQTFLQRLKTHLKDLLRKSTDGQTKYSIYTQQFQTYQQALDQYEALVNQISQEVDTWANPNKSISIETIQRTNDKFKALVQDQISVQRQANLFHELTEALLDSVENPNHFR